MSNVEAAAWLITALCVVFVIITINAADKRVKEARIAAKNEILGAREETSRYKELYHVTYEALLKTKYEKRESGK